MLGKGPYQVLLANPCAAKLQGVGCGIHTAHLKKASPPEWTATPISDSQLWLRKAPPSQKKKMTAVVDS